jgi:hypothetical protein
MKTCRCVFFDIFLSKQSDGAPGVIEYSEIDRSLAEEKTADGTLKFNTSHLCMNGFSVDFLQSMADSQRVISRIAFFLSIISLFFFLAGFRLHSHFSIYLLSIFISIFLIRFSSRLSISLSLSLSLSLSP